MIPTVDDGQSELGEDVERTLEKIDSAITSFPKIYQDVP